MQIAIPAMGRQGLSERAADHFGRCAAYAILDGKGKLLSVLDNERIHSGGKELPAEFLKRQGVDTLLCKGLGPRALALCQQLGITVYVVDGDTVIELFTKWQKKPCQPATSDDVCEEHRK